VRKGAQRYAQAFATPELSNSIGIFKFSIAGGDLHTFLQQQISGGTEIDI